MQQILKLLGNDKGRDANRTVLLALCLYTAFKVSELEKTVTAHLVHHAAPRIAQTVPAVVPPPGDLPAIEHATR